MPPAPTDSILPPPPRSARAALAVRYAPSAGGTLCLLYLHGFGSNQSGEKAEFFRARAVERGLGFCSFDFAGHGSSAGTMRELTLSGNLSDIARVRDWLVERGETRIALLGSSMGGGSALWYAALHPEHVVAGLHLAPALALERLLLEEAGAQGAQDWEATGVLEFHNEFVSCELGWELIADLRRYPVSQLYGLQRTPTLVLQGQLDDQVPWAGAVELCAASQGTVELHLFADGDHRLNDRKERLWDLMLEFLSGRGLLDRSRLPAPLLSAGSPPAP